MISRDISSYSADKLHHSLRSFHGAVGQRVLNGTAGRRMYGDGRLLMQICPSISSSRSNPNTRLMNLQLELLESDGDIGYASFSPVRQL